MPSLLLSACLAGRPCRYDGRARPAPRVEQLLARWAGEVVLACPEELAGLGTPRPEAELSGGDGADLLAGRARVLRRIDGVDLSAAFASGAERAAGLGADATLAVLKARSPSCGCGETWVDGEVRPGDGVFAALLRQRGVTVLSDEDPAVDRLASGAPGAPA